MPDLPPMELPDATGALVVDARRAWSADEVWDTADRIAHLARAATAPPPGGSRRRVAVFAENAAEAAIAHVGAMRSGASVVAVNSHLAAPEAAYQLEAGDVALVIAGPDTADRARTAAALVGRCEVRPWSDPDWGAWLAAAPAGPPPDDVPIVPNLLFTSGTTGTPKATHLPPNVFPTRASWADFVTATGANRFVGLGRHLVVAPLHHTGPLNAVRALSVGTPVGLLPRFDAPAALTAIDRWQVASTTVVPTHLARLLAVPQADRAHFDVSSLRLVFLTGAACPIDVKRGIIDWFGPVVLEAYGATEVGVTNSITSEDWLTHVGSVGRSVAPYTAVVVDEAGQELAPGEEGRLYFRDSTGRGIVYEGDPDRTAAAHIAPGVFTLGEIGKIDADGWVYITDRFSDMVVTGGVNVYPAEMEQVLVAHPSVADVAGIGTAHPDLGEQLVALVVPADLDEPPTIAELQAWCEDRLSRYKCPREIRLVTDLGRNALGKLDKRSLRAAQA
ncbi:AMP-binding protein [Aquihabitans sp. McL0605]|uniref:AMP-binding protein n=1 Tax=Aquihabitans sp. McL0605 TaxID=3415671 RepID=UPI003CF63D67